jgi:hypothetical protein
MIKIVKKPENPKINLPHGAQKIIALKANVSDHTVRNVLNGTSQNWDVLKAIKEYLNEYKEIKTDINEVAGELSLLTA